LHGCARHPDEGEGDEIPGSLARLSQDTSIHVTISPFAEALDQMPPADLVIFGLSHQPDIDLVYGLAQKLKSPCVFCGISGTKACWPEPCLLL
jgi:hypothetical protein